MLWQPRSGMSAGRPACPRCGHARTVRWGSSGGRQRHRCKGCGRTFGAFTGTPFQGLRRPSAWMVFADSLARGDSVRLSATRCGVAPSTAFRWRHAFLAGAARTRSVPGDAAAHSAGTPNGDGRDSLLAGTVGCRELRLPESFKGRSPPDRAPRTHAVPWGRKNLAGRRSWILILGAARSEGSRTLRCRVVSVGTLSRPPWPSLLEEVRRAHLHPRARLASSRSIRWTRLTRKPLYRAREQEQARGAGRAGTLAAGLVRARLRDWMVRFRGIATRYLENYLAWYSAWCVLSPRGFRRPEADAGFGVLGTEANAGGSPHAGSALLIALAGDGDIPVDRSLLWDPGWLGG